MHLMPEPSSIAPMLEWETRVGFSRILVAGVDEVGRGCLAGPVVAAVVVLPPVVDWVGASWLNEVTDSKALTPARRERLAPLLQQWARAWAVGQASVAEIDRINILQASHLAMLRAIEGLPAEARPQHVLVDGNALPKGLKGPATAVVKGDSRCLSIAAASVIAKVWRDTHMVELDRVYPGYGLADHKGYGTPAHLKALGQLGVTEMHRRSFSPVAAAAARLA